MIEWQGALPAPEHQEVQTVTRRPWRAVCGVASLAVVGASVAAPMPAWGRSAAVAVSEQDPAPGSVGRSDNLPNPLAEGQAELRQDAVTRLLTGDATTRVVGGDRVIELAGAAPGASRFVDYPEHRQEHVLTILTDFGAAVARAAGGAPGPAHNQIPSPDRLWDGNSTDDNTTFWTADFSRQHYLDLMFGAGESLRDFYLEQSSGRLAVTGDVSDWVSLPYNEAYYGHEADRGNGYGTYLKDTAAAWYRAQLEAGRGVAEITAYLKQFDQLDRYDHDGDGDFTEPDGYLDHVQAVHAGMGAETGAGQGQKAMWSHHGYAFSANVGRTGPDGNRLGGVPLGDTGIWIGDYTIEPENGGLGVFAHEFAHDLGLPDLYDTSGGENGTGFWTLMGAGSWLSNDGEAIGMTPGSLGAWEKLQLGWLDAAVLRYGVDRAIRLGPADRGDPKRPPPAGALPQALAVMLPDQSVRARQSTPHSGATQWWSGSADNLVSTLTRTIDLRAAATARITAALQTWIEPGHDHLYVEASSDGGQSWTRLDTLTGDSDGWVPRGWDLREFAGSVVSFRLRYVTDAGVHRPGVFLDDIATTIDGATSTDDAESGAAGWSPDGFALTSGTITRQVPHYYLAENRTYRGYDATLQAGPYNPGFAGTRENWVERFPYQNGLLVWYVDGAYGDNDTRTHPGHGQVLPVDARPAPVTFPGGAALGNRRQPFDATFGQERTDPVTFHRDGVPVVVPARPGLPTFDDTDPIRYWSPDNPGNSVQVAGSGTALTVTHTGARAEELVIEARFE